VTMECGSPPSAVPTAGRPPLDATGTPAVSAPADATLLRMGAQGKRAERAPRWRQNAPLVCGTCHPDLELRLSAPRGGTPQPEADRERRRR
jgi:hypothetical protein